MASKTPMYKFIENDIKQKIKKGEYIEGALIPKEIELAQAYSVSRPTIRQALNNLTLQGYLERKKKRGTVVKATKVSQEFSKVFESFGAEMNRKGFKSSNKILFSGFESATHEIAYNLQISVDDPVYKFVRLRSINKIPMLLSTTYVPGALVEGIEAYDFAVDSFYDALADLGHVISSITRKLEVIHASDDLAVLLAVAVDDPVIYFSSTAYNLDRIVLEYTLSEYRADVTSFVFEITN